MAGLSLSDRLTARNPKKAYDKAKELLKSGEAERAFNLFVAAADAGMVEAIHEAAERYLKGDGVLHNKIEAGRWFLRAAERGYAPSQCQLAGMHLFGLQASSLGLGATGLFAQDESVTPDYPAALAWSAKAAAAGDVDAQAMLAYIYTSGPADIRDEAKAEYWYDMAARGDSAQGKLGLGLILLRRAETAELTVAAVDMIRAAADAGLPTAHYYLGLIYEKAIGVYADMSRAVGHYKIGAEAGVRNAQAKYGLMLLEGNGTKADPVEGETWLRRAALAGDWEAAALVGDMYAKGGALPPNYAEAAIWFRRSAEQGHSAAARALGMLYLTGAGVARDPDEAAAWFTKAAEAGDAVAQADLASLLLSGVTDKKLTKAPPVHEWFEKAAEAGDLIGAYNFGVCLARGVGIPRDDARAAVWMRRAAEAVPDAQYWYGRMRFEGIGVPADPEEAVVWLQRAADANVTLALVTLADLKVNGRGCKKNVEEAINLFKRAAETGHAGAMFALAQLYAIEKLSSFDKDFANEWLSSAAKRGHLRATEILSQKDKGDRNTAQISESVNARRPIYHRPMRLPKFHWHPRRRHPIDDWS